MSWLGPLKTLVEGTKARAADVQGDIETLRDGLLYLLSEEEHSLFPQLSEAAKRVLTMSADVVLYGTGGVSQFLQLPETAKRRVLWGRINSFGGKNGGSAGWSVAHTGTGIYTITLESALSTIATCIAVPADEAGNDYIRVHATSTSSVQIRTFDAGFNLEDRGVNFVIFG